MSASRPRALEPRSLAFRRERESEWLALEDLLERALPRGLSALEEEELHSLPMLYRGAVSSLEVARATTLDRELVDYLEALVGRGYLAIYGARRSQPFELARLLLFRFPEAVQQSLPELALAVLLFTLGVALAWVLVQHDGAWYFTFVSEGMAGGRHPGSSTEQLRGALYEDGQGTGLSVFGALLFSHNTGIGLLAFAVGFAAGIPTAYLIFTNGLVLGAFLGLYDGRGLLLPLLGWLLPHGVPEITAILLCGAGGLAMARALLLPGERSVRQALVIAGHRGAILVMGSVVLFFVAGILEGVFRQSVLDEPSRFAMASFNATWLLCWLVVPTVWMRWRRGSAP